MIPRVAAELALRLAALSVGASVTFQVLRWLG